MFKGISLCILAIGSALFAQPVPARPEMLVYKPLAFQVPREKDYAFKLNNGIPVYLASDPNGIPFLRVNVMIRGGQNLEPKGKEGITDLAGSLWRNGGALRTPADKLDERLDFLAAEIRSEIGATEGTISMQVQEKDLKEGLDLFTQVLFEPAFAQDRLDLAKEGLRQAVRSRNDFIEDIANYQLSFLLNGEGHFLSALPTEASLTSITREDLQTFHRRLLHPANLVISVSGKSDRKTLLNLLNQTIGRFLSSREARISPKAPAPIHVRKPGIYLVDKDVPQSVVALAIPGLRRTDPDWHAVEVMNYLLGGSGFTSRLMKKLRSDEGLTYGIKSEIGEGPHWRDDFFCSLQTKNRSVPFALRLILAELERIKRELVSNEEMNAIKAGIIQGFPAEWGNQTAVVQKFASERLLGWPSDWWADYREKIQTVTREDVQRVARKYLDTSQSVILVVGKAAEVEAGDAKDHPGLLKDVVQLPLQRLPLWDPLTMRPLK